MLKPVVVSSPKPRHAPLIESDSRGVPKQARPGRAATSTKPAPPTGANRESAQTPLNTNVAATSASRLGLTVRETPASVEVVDQQAMHEQGYRTTTETAQGAVGVLSGDAAGAPGGFSMRGFSFGEVNVLYNGI